MNFKLEKVKLNIDKNRSKYEINYEYKTKIKELFGQFCSEIKNYLKKYMGDNVDTKPVDDLQEDYNNFFEDPNYELKFEYVKKYTFKKGEKNNYNKAELVKNDFKILRDEIDESLCSKEDKVKFIIVEILLNIFKDLEYYIQINSCLTPKQFYNYNYFIDSQPRCCFCGQLLESSIKEDKNNKNKKEEYIHADIEHIIPKDLFPQFTLHPDNWAPCCKECNMGEKRTAFFEGSTPQEKIDKYKSAIKALGLEYNKLHPLKLWKNYKTTYNKSLNIEINNNYTNKENDENYKNVTDFLNFYGIKNRIEIIASRCYDILFNIIRHSDIRSPESLERLLENMASSNWHEINDGYSLNNSPQIWQEFIESILYDECKLMALWDEVKSMNMSIF